ncbi:GerAB/ArcD/ProY family transporter [Anaerophilus nitritogenes]|uniref:GerAB/ArcD/ProY family transporter n=1 Tax=Anaerophilus nitritogenes TaxID=2498136 RepID=UPI0013EB047A|nr:endospore germination permease [Anaerophilus nitritogenes]
MDKEIISDSQGISIAVLFLSGTSTILVMALSAKGDFWIAIILALLLSLVICLILIGLHNQFPGKNLYDIHEICYGRFLGKIISFLYMYFLFEEGIAVFTNTKQFITETGILETPQIITVIPLALLCAWAVKLGIEVIGRWAKLFMIIFVIVVSCMCILLLPRLELSNMEPILYNGVEPLLEGTFMAFAFPFGQVIMLAFVFENFKTKKSSKKIYIGGLIFAGIIGMSNSLITVLFLGIDISTSSYFPVFHAAAGIDIGDFIQRLEIFTVLIGVFGAFLKNSILLLGVCKGLGKIFNVLNYKSLAMPVVLMMLIGSEIYHPSRMEFLYWNTYVWSYYAVIFESVFPILLLITSKFKKDRI